MRPRALGCALLVLGLPAARLDAQEPAAPHQSPLRYHVGLWPDVALALGMTAVAAALPSMNDTVPAHCAPCDPSDLWPIDRVAVGPYESGPGTASDITLRTTIAGGALLLVAARGGQGLAPRAEDVVVYTESVALAQVATSALRQAIGRSRPIMYTSAATPTVTRDALSSLPSLHATTAFAAAAACASVLHRRGELHRHSVAVGALVVLATATAALRVAAHKHFPTDVAAGAVLGTAVGWTIPALHPVTHPTLER